MPKTIFMTGQSGFVGAALTEAMKEEYKIVPLVGDILDYASVKKQLEEADPNFIIHLAARTEVETSFYEPTSFSSINYVGSVNMIEASKNLPHLELFIFASTNETYGNQPKELWTAFDEHTPQNPSAPYAVAKVGCEKYLEYARQYYGLPYTILRQTNAYGRKDNDFFVVERIISQMLLNKDRVELGNREPWRNFLHIDDLVDLYQTILKNVHLAKGEVFCTGPDRPVQIKKLAQYIAAELQWKGEIVWGTRPERKGEVYFLNSTPAKATRVLGWEPEVELEYGLRKTIYHWKQKLGIPETNNTIGKEVNYVKENQS